MFVVKRDGSQEKVSFDKILYRISNLCYGLDARFVDPIVVAQKTVQGLYNGVTTSELDNLAAETAAYMTTVHTDYPILAARISISNLQKQTPKTFSEYARLLYTYIDPRTGLAAPLLNPQTYAVIEKHAELLNKTIKNERDFYFDYFGFKTLEKTYLLKLHGKIVERPQYMWMRVAVGIHGEDIAAVLDTYEDMSEKWYTHATPTLFNAGTPNHQLSSCFLVALKDDSIEGIYDTLKECAIISKNAGGIGVHVSNVRATGSYIKGTNGTSNGIIPMLKVFNETARYVDQCFAPGTLVSTKKGTRKIEDVQVGDFVHSHTGACCRVERVLKHVLERQKILKIVMEQPSYALTFRYGQDLTTYVTPTHQVLVHKPLEKKREYVDAEELRVGDLMCFNTLSEMFSEPTYEYLAVKSIEIEEYEGPVYDFEVEDDHTYETQMGIVHNGGGKRKGAIAVYLEPWHADVFAFLELRKNHGNEAQRARDLFLALWTPDLFMERVRDNKEWSLMCPHECPGLQDAVGPAFKALYESYEAQGKFKRQIKARELWSAILDAQMETGTPYMLYKDACNQKSNQKNLGVIKSSNLCTEIVEYSDPDETAVCNLASISLPRFVTTYTHGLNENLVDSCRVAPGTAPAFDHQKLYEVVKRVTRNLNRVIDINFYPTATTKKSNLRHRPMGIGIQGLADVFILLKLPFESPEASMLNFEIMETVYYASLVASMEEAKERGTYESFVGSPASQGILQFDMWDANTKNKNEQEYYADRTKFSGRWDWASLKRDIAQFGLRNSLLLAPMPTASTAQILGNNEAFEPYTYNIFLRRVLSGEFVCVNKHLVKDLVELDLWNEDMRQKIIKERGSVQNIVEIPAPIREIYKTVWEIKQRNIIRMAAERGRFIDQSQSMNIFIAHPTVDVMNTMHFYGWQMGLKTGCYYLRTQAKADAVQVTVDPTLSLSSSSSSSSSLSQSTTTKNTKNARQTSPPPSFSSSSSSVLNNNNTRIGSPSSSSSLQNSSFALQSMTSVSGSNVDNTNDKSNISVESEGSAETKGTEKESIDEFCPIGCLSCGS